MVRTYKKKHNTKKHNTKNLKAKKPKAKKPKASKKQEIVKAGMLGRSQRFDDFNFGNSGPAIRSYLIRSLRSLNNLEILDDATLANIYDTLNFREELNMLQAGTFNATYPSPELNAEQDENGKECLYIIFRGLEREIIEEDLLHLVNKHGQINPLYHRGTDEDKVNQKLRDMFPNVEIINN